MSTAVEAKLWLSVCSLHPGVDLLCLLSFALQSSTFTIWCEAWIAALFSLSCDRNFYHEHNGEEQERVLHLNNGEPGKSVYNLWSGICMYRCEQAQVGKTGHHVGGAG